MALIVGLSPEAVAADRLASEVRAAEASSRVTTYALEMSSPQHVHGCKNGTTKVKHPLDYVLLTHVAAWLTWIDLGWMIALSLPLAFLLGPTNWLLANFLYYVARQLATYAHKGYLRWREFVVVNAGGYLSHYSTERRAAICGPCKYNRPASDGHRRCTKKDAQCNCPI